MNTYYCAGGTLHLRNAIDFTLSIFFGELPIFHVFVISIHSNLGGQNFKFHLFSDGFHYWRLCEAFCYIQGSTLPHFNIFYISINSWFFTGLIRNSAAFRCTHF